MIPVENYIVLSSALFVIGLAIVIVKKNLIVVLMGIEFMLNASGINFIVFSKMDKNIFTGQVFTLFIIILAAAEAAVALAIILNVYRHFKTTDIDKINQLKG